MAKKQALQFTARVETQQGKRDIDNYNMREEIKNYENKDKEHLILPIKSM